MSPERRNYMIALIKIRTATIKFRKLYRKEIATIVENYGEKIFSPTDVEAILAEYFPRLSSDPTLRAVALRGVSQILKRELGWIERGEKIRIPIADGDNVKMGEAIAIWFERSAMLPATINISDYH